MIFQIIIPILMVTQYLLADDWDSDVVSTDSETYNVQLFSEGYIIPWGLAFLPNGDLLVNDISGKMYRVLSDGSEKSEITGVPDVYYRGQGGLLDVEVHPNFQENNIVYISYSDLIDKPFKNISFTAVAKAELINNELKKLKVTPGEAYRIIANLKDKTSSIRYDWKMLRLTMYVWERLHESEKLFNRPKIDTIRDGC